MSNPRNLSTFQLLSLAAIWGCPTRNAIATVDASCFAIGKPKPFDWERDRRLNEERMAKAQAKRERKAARKNLNSPKPT